jgi:DNA-binding NtrC family response regulator
MADSFKGKLETILVVDDDKAILATVTAILKRQNFKVLSADCAANAIRVANETVGRIELLLSDVSMPNMSGLDLGEVLKKARPDMRVMLMSAYENGALPVLNHGWAFLQKPFVAMKLIEMVNDVLHPAVTQP